MCRYRTVCKRWDRLICDPKFGSLCAQNPAKREASFIAMRYSIGGMGHLGWCFLDVNARRWYVFKDDGQSNRRNFSRNFPVRMDGGLVCQYLCSNRIIVYNPMSQTHREVPTVPRKCLASFKFQEVIFVVDNISQSFKIFLFYISHPHDLKNVLKLVYDSVTNEWKTSTSPLCITSGSKLLESRVLFRGVLFGGYLYTYLRKEHTLWRYNLVKDTWENLDVLIRDVFSSARLVVSANRLFSVAWSRGSGLRFDDGGPWLFQLSELKISDMTREVLFEMSEADVKERFETGIENQWHKLPSISAFSFGNSILFMSDSTGVTAAFDVVTRSWDRNFPPNPLEYLPHEGCLWVGEQMNLLLPCTLW
ncbi:hypothetical protein KC19_9G182600 [Ceratodon purpureus]|uniref:Uncharacterized protein n=1 Tax=Ceratodon purpureus TaxID=3225 RepID=A0A8T0GTB5_CERPU|nr:hypothetical protein KC19_9G182600 [Ceratodon purpureus]KAG0562916.1 hypothetical protein KC19_9G182600 [Ceratodon purpureus]